MIRYAPFLAALSLCVISLAGCSDSFYEPAPANMVNRVVGTGSLMVNGISTSYGIVERGPEGGPLQTYHRFVMPNGTFVDCAPATAEACVRENLARFPPGTTLPAGTRPSLESPEQGH